MNESPFIEAVESGCPVHLKAPFFSFKDLMPDSLRGVLIRRFLNFHQYDEVMSSWLLL